MGHAAYRFTKSARRLKHYVSRKINKLHQLSYVLQILVQFSQLTHKTFAHVLHEYGRLSELFCALLYTALPRLSLPKHVIKECMWNCFALKAMHNGHLM